jgi:hypothetical protein
MKCPDVKDMTRLIKRLAVDMRSKSIEVRQADFLERFRAECAALLTPEQVAFTTDQYAWKIARAALKDVEDEAERETDPAQLPLPGFLSHLKIPLSLPIDRGGERICVTTIFATLQDCDDYDAGLTANIDSCTTRRGDFREMMWVARPVMLANPRWTLGDALAWLGAEEKAAAQFQRSHV